MISEDKEVKDEDLVLIDEFTRPTIIPDKPKTKEYWLKFHDIVKNSDIEIWVNGMFGYIEEVLSKSDGSYFGSGYRYNFWVRSQEDKDKFLEMVNYKPVPEVDRFVEKHKNVDRGFNTVLELYGHKPVSELWHGLGGDGI